MKHDAFARFHPAVNFIFFLGAIGFGVVLRHPAYIVMSAAWGSIFWLQLAGRSGWKLLAGMIPAFCLISLINPLFNTLGGTVLFRVFGKPYTLEALCYGMATGGMFAVMMVWFSCYNKILTGDKFTALFGTLIPALSLLLVMVLRMIPNLSRKARQITGARDAIGKGISGTTRRQQLRGGITAVSALTDWALEGSIITADSMRARGYGAARRTNFRLYRMTGPDWLLLAVMAALVVWVIAAGGSGAAFTPEILIDRPGAGLLAYGLYLMIPAATQWKEAVQWHISISKI